SPDGSRLATVARAPVTQGSGQVLVWDPRTGKELCRLKGHASAVASVAFSPDSKRIATAGQDEIKLWDVATGKELLSLKWESSGAAVGQEVSFSRDGTRLFLSRNRDIGGVRIWDATPLPEKR